MWRPDFARPTGITDRRPKSDAPACTSELVAGDVEFDRRDIYASS